MKIVKILFTWLVLPAAIIALAYLTVMSVMKPVEFNNVRDARKEVAVQRLKDIRTLQEAYKSMNSKYTTLDSLVLFYNEGQVEVTKKFGDSNDSTLNANTAEVKKKLVAKFGKKSVDKNLDAYLKQIYDGELKGFKQDQNLIFSVRTLIPVKDTLFVDRKDFVVDSLLYIPFSGGEKVICNETVKVVSGVDVPLFEAKMPYKALLKGLDNQERINLDASCKEKGQYPGLMVGSIDTPNNNAGNWE